MLTPDQLNASLAEFATSNMTDQKNIFPHLWNQLAQATEEQIRTPELVRSFTQAAVTVAVDKVKDTKFKLADGTTVRPYTGDYGAIIALGLDGKIMAADSSRSGIAYEREGDLYRHALQKAVIRLLRPRAGLDDAQTYDYVARLLPNKHIYLGEAIADGSGLVERMSLIIGASGCELTDEYRESLAPEMLNAKSEETGSDYKVRSEYFEAGYADQVFAQRVAFHYSNPYLRNRLTLHEPEFFSLLRRSH